MSGGHCHRVIWEQNARSNSCPNMHGPGFNWERFIFSSTGELILTKPFTPARALPKFWGGKIWTKFLFCEPRKYINQIFLVFWALLLKIQSVITASISRVRRSFLNSWDISSTSFGITPIETQKRKYKNLDPKQTVHKSQKHYPAPCIHADGVALIVRKLGLLRCDMVASAT